MGAFAGGVVLTLFVGFLAYKLRYLSVHKKAAKPVSTSGSGGGGSGSDAGSRTHRH